MKTYPTYIGNLEIKNKTSRKKNINELEIWNLSSMKHLIFSSESSWPPNFKVLFIFYFIFIFIFKLYELCKHCHRNPP